MKTGLKKRQKHTEIYFNEESPIIEFTLTTPTLKTVLRRMRRNIPSIADSSMTMNKVD